MIGAIIICFAAFFFLVFLTRRAGWRGSLGLPVVYLSLLLFWHVPGGLVIAFATNSSYAFGDVTACTIGMQLTAIGSISFVSGVWLARRKSVISKRGESVGMEGTPRQFWSFCLIVGVFLVVVLGPLHNIPSVGAVARGGGGIWMLGAMLGIRAGFRQESLGQILLWGSIVLIYLLYMLLAGGFLCFGFTAVIFCLATLTVSTRNMWRVTVGIVTFSVLGVTVFVSYFANRDELRAAVWGQDTMEMRIAAAQKMFQDIKWLDFSDDSMVRAIDQRLNQNYFVGLAAQRIEMGTAQFINGRSIGDGLMALVPRIVWADKPIFAGSQRIVQEMTGLELVETASWAVGNVLEFYINFGFSGVIVGFIGLGWIIGRLDFLGGKAEGSGNTSDLLLCFLLVVPLVQQNSIAQMTGDAAAGWIAAYGWSWLWGIVKGQARSPAGRGRGRKPARRGKLGVTVIGK